MAIHPSRVATDRGFRFTRLHLVNWRNFQLAEVHLQNRVFLAGANASGKSNFLDAFRFLRDIVSMGGGFQEAVSGKRGGISKLRCLAARRYPDIEIDVNVGSDSEKERWRYVLHFSQENRQRPIVKKEIVQRGDKVLVKRPDEQDNADPERRTQTYLEQVNVNKDFRELVEFFASIRYFHIVPQLVREPDRSVGRRNDPFGGDFLEQVARSTVKKRGWKFRRIQEALKVAIPQLQKIELWRDARGTPHLRGKYEHWRPQGAWQSEEQFSDGTLRLMGLLWAAMEGSGPLLLEEPELSMHPVIVRSLPQMFARLQRRSGRQIFISTHSPELFRDEGIGQDEVLLLCPGKEGTEVALAGSFEEIRHLLEEGVTLDEAIVTKTTPERAQQLTLFGDQ